MRFARLFFRALQPIAPEQTAAWAERLFFTPPQARLSPRQRAVLEHGAPFTLQTGGRRVTGWSWGRGGSPTVFLMHGWGSRGGRLARFVGPLVAAGYRVVTHDAPGQGASDPGLTSMPEYARAFRAVADAAGPVHAVIAHSMGASATALAMAQGLAVPRAVFLAPVANPAAYVGPFAAALGLSPEIVRRLRERSERRIAFRWADLDIPALVRDREFDIPLLIFHDREDRVVPWSDGVAIAAAWRGAELVGVTGLGHRGIVGDSGVVARTVEFVTGVPARSVEGPTSWSAITLEHELFHPADRKRPVRVTSV
jgi:pimeloyl-ACP methyl ester carboxylesterase